MMKNTERSKRNETVSGIYEEANPIETLDKTNYHGNYINDNQKCTNIRNSDDGSRVKGSKMANMKDTADPDYTKVQEVEIKDDFCNILAETDEFSKINKNDHLEFPVKPCSKSTKVTTGVQLKTIQKEQIDQHSSQTVSKPKCQNGEQAAKLTSHADGSDGGSHHETRDRKLSRQKSEVQTMKTRCRHYSPTGFQFGFFILTTPSLLVSFGPLIHVSTQRKRYQLVFNMK